MGRPGVSSFCRYAYAGDRNVTIRVRAYFKWDNFSTITGEWATSPAITVPCWV